MREFKEITVDELRTGDKFVIGDYKCTLHGHERYFFVLNGGEKSSSNSSLYEQFGITRSELDAFLEYKTSGGFPEVAIGDLAKLYNWFYEKWKAHKYTKKVIEKSITLDGGEVLILPLNVESQNHWDIIWPKLKKIGFTWADGDELDSFFSGCHEFPEHIDQQSDLKLIIDDELTKII